VADSWILPTDALYPDVQASIPRFAYDPQRSQQLLTEAGWIKGSDGLLTNRGEPFRTELWGSTGEAASPEKTLNIIANSWREVGVQADLNIVAPARLNDREYRALHPGPFLATQASQRLAINGLHSIQTPTVNNRWSGFNRGGYSNPRVDSVLDRLNTTIPAAERIPLHRELLQEQMGDVALMPLYWEVVPILMVKGVRGPVFYRQNASWNIFQWDRE
jgi:peptide/nickel transport system substrate-binding protein